MSAHGRPLRRQSGMTLAEMLVAMVIGLAVLAGFTQIFISGRQSYETQSGVGKLQENGRVALFFLQRDLRMAGFPRSFGPGAAQPLNRAFVPANSTDGSGTAPDRVEMQWNSDPLLPDSDRDCLGQQSAVVNADGTRRVISRYYVAADAQGVPNLYCLGNGNATAQPMVAGVENFQVQYGLDLDDDDYADTYVNATQVTAQSAWRQIAAVRVALLVNSGEALAEDDDVQEYALLDAPLISAINLPATSPNELRYRRRVFTSTIEIRNRTP